MNAFEHIEQIYSSDKYNHDKNIRVNIYKLT